METTSSDNYRAIAGGSLLLKILDLVIIMLEGSKLGFSELQFAYQASTSTTVCSWAVTSVVDYFNRNGFFVYAATMDMSKAFDNVEWFQLLMSYGEGRLGQYILDCCFIFINSKLVKLSGLVLTLSSFH